MKQGFEIGRFITFEGGEGTGKSTQAAILAERLSHSGRPVFATREPGGSPRAEQIRAVLLSGDVAPLGPLAETVLFSVARADHVDNAILGALQQGQWVVCDRFMDSTRAYQGASSGVPRALINALERISIGALSPDITFILDIPAEEGLARVKARADGEDLDRFESEELMSHERIRRAFLDIADEEPQRCIVVDASQPEAMVAEDVWESVLQRLNP